MTRKYPEKYTTICLKKEIHECDFESGSCGCELCIEEGFNDCLEKIKKALFPTEEDRYYGIKLSYNRFKEIIEVLLNLRDF